MSYKKLEELLVWGEAKYLVVETYRLFKNTKDFSFRDQVQRASVSVMNNIAEGYERDGDKEFRRFLYFAKGSCGEVRSMLYIAKELNYVSEEEFKDMYHQTEKISKMLAGLIKKL